MKSLILLFTLSLGLGIAAIAGDTKPATQETKKAKAAKDDCECLKTGEPCKNAECRKSDVAEGLNAAQKDFRKFLRKTVGNNHTDADKQDKPEDKK